MASTNDFLVKLLAQLDTSSINPEYEKLKKRLTNDPIIQKVTLDTSMSKQAIKTMATEIHNELGKAFKATGIEDFDITVKDVESILSSAVKESNKLAKELENASSKAQKFLAQFNNKSGGTLVNSKEFKAVQDAINGLGKTSSIDDLNKAMNTLETTYNNMVSSLRNSGKSLNPFINAKNEMATMDDTIKGIGLEFEKLANKPKSVSEAIKQLSAQQANVNSYTIGTQEWADAYGKLQQMIQKVKSEISNLQKAQSANVSTQIFNTVDLDKQGKVYIQKIRNTIEAIKPELESKLRSAGYTDIEIKGVEKANGQIKSLTATVTDATGAFKQLNFQREKIQGKGKAQFGFIQTDDVKVIGTLSSSVEKVQGNLTTLKSKWEEQGVLVGDFKTKVEQLETSLASVGSKGELNGLKSQIETLKTEASSIADVNKIQLSFDTGSYQSKVDSLVARTNQWVDANGNARISTESLQTALSNLGTAYNNLNSSGGNTVANQQALIEAEKALDAEVKRVQSSVTSMNATMAKSSAVDSLRQKIQQFYDINTASHGRWGNDLKNIMSQLANGAEVPIVKLKELEKQFITIQNSARQAGKLGLSFFDGIIEQAKKFTQWVSVTSVVMEGIRIGKDMIQDVRELDDSLLELTKVSDLSVEGLENVTNQAYEFGEKVARTGKEVIDATTEFKRAGFDMQQSMDMAESAMVMTNVAENITDTADAAGTLISVLKGFNMDASETMTIVDKINQVSNTSPIGFDNIAEGLERTAGTMAQSGNTIDQTIGLITAGYAQLRNVEKVSTGLITLSARLRGVDEEGETIDGLSAKLQEDFGKIGVAIENADGSLRSIYEIAQDYSKVLPTLSDKQKQYYAELAAGYSMINRVSSNVQKCA